MLGYAAVSESAYESFLYASIGEQNDGTQVTVLSALVRADIDPWTEAARLAAMPKAEAEAKLGSILYQISGQSWTDFELKAICERLVQLLPTKHGGGPAKLTSPPIGEVDRSIFWLVWLGFVLAVCLSSPRDRTSIREPGSAVTSHALFSAAAGNAADQE